MKTKTLVSIILLCCFCLAFASCGKTDIAPSAQLAAGDLMKDIKANDVKGKPADVAFVTAHDEFAAKLFKSAFARANGENVLVSPLSVTLALAMTANGAKGETLAEMEKLLGGEMDIKALNEYLKYYVSHLYSGEKCKLASANSVWFREGLEVLPQFLQANADYYGAAAYEEPFDEKTLELINGWVKEHTDGMIEKILEEIAPDSIMFLINAIVFDAEWAEQFEESDISKRSFTKADGTVQNDREFMYSTEEYMGYGGAEGFKKKYSGGKYSFAAVLPPENVSISDYIASLNGEKLAATLGSARNDPVRIYLPKFSFDYDIKLKETLTAMGMPSAFSSGKADFGGIAENAEGALYIGEVIHKTHIEVDARGTKAAAVTVVDMRAEGMAVEPDPVRTIVFDRPFVFMIIDDDTDLPIFIGAVAGLDE
ncbi:MAG: serpin family protein [Clostridia bacterium]|nr:serpin family protein [Clostridia bacterium]